MQFVHKQNNGVAQIPLGATHIRQQAFFVKNVLSSTCNFG